LSAQEFLTLRAVTASYAKLLPEAQPELDGVDLAISEGEIVAVLGPNGAGKTTLVRVASGLLPPLSGEVRLLGEPLHSPRSRPRSWVARTLAVVEQMPTVFGNFTVHDVVAMGRAPHQGAWMSVSPEDERIVRDALARCELTALATRPARALSGGEQKRVAVARALAQQPKVLLLDEPGAFLDVRHQLDLYELLAAEVKARGIAGLVVMHDLNVAAQFADRVILMKRGKVVASGPVSEVMTPAVLRETFDVELETLERGGARYFFPRRGLRDNAG
jgi:iron complex transport system ATP-binding protein